MRSDNLYKYRKPLLIVGLVILLVFIIFRFVSTQRFHVVSTDPSVSSVADISPFLKINFNKTLSSSKPVSLSSSSVVQSFQVQGKTLLINLNTPMITNKAYSIDVSSVYDEAGAKLSNLVFKFSPQNISFQDLPQNQQATILQKQTAYKNPTNNIGFTGTNTLINYGISSTQIYYLETYFFDFKPSAKTIAISPNGIENYNDTSGGTVSFSIDFNVMVDSVAYKAVGSYSNVNSISLELYNPQTGASVFDSTNYTAPGGD